MDEATEGSSTHFWITIPDNKKTLGAIWDALHDTATDEVLRKAPTNPFFPLDTSLCKATVTKVFLPVLIECLKQKIAKGNFIVDGKQVTPNSVDNLKITEDVQNLLRLFYFSSLRDMMNKACDKAKKNGRKTALLSDQLHATLEIWGEQDKHRTFGDLVTYAIRNGELDLRHIYTHTGNSRKLGIEHGSMDESQGHGPDNYTGFGQFGRSRVSMQNNHGRSELPAVDLPNGGKIKNTIEPVSMQESGDEEEESQTSGSSSSNDARLTRKTAPTTSQGEKRPRDEQEGDDDEPLNETADEEPAKSSQPAKKKRKKPAKKTTKETAKEEPTDAKKFTKKQPKKKGKKKLVDEPVPKSGNEIMFV